MVNDLWRHRLFSRQEMEKIHERSLYILDRVGIKIPHQKCLEALGEAGAKVDFGSERATFPKTLVEDCLKKATKAFNLAARESK